MKPKDAEVSFVNAVERILSYAEGLPGLRTKGGSRDGYGHMGAIICDAGLQAGLNYRNVVAPRVQRMLEHWPTATTASAFLAKAERFGLHGVLAWRDDEKPSRILSLARFLVGQRVETESDLREWLGSGRGAELRCLRGIGPKTVDYLMVLVGLPTVAIDRHLRTLLMWAGAEGLNYETARKVLCVAADHLEIDPALLDQAVWQFISASRG